MYLEYFGLLERPFSIAPDPHYLYMSARHKEAMAHLTYGVSQGGCFIVLTGEVGTGKTTLCRNLLSDLPKDIEVALILNANINEQELLQTICDELKIGYLESDSQKALLDKLNAHLLAGFAKNQQTVLIIDEAQLLSRDVLEQIRLLTNLETTKSKLLQIILIGQPELNDLLSRNDLRQLAQRVTARYHLGALKRNEIEDYVNFRLSVAGCRKPLFTKQALTQLHRSTDGIPRRINVLADHALLSTYTKNHAVVDAKSVKESTKEVFVQASKPVVSRRINYRWGAAILGLLLVNALILWWFVGRSDDTAIVANNKVSGVQAVSQNAGESGAAAVKGNAQQIKPEVNVDPVVSGGVNPSVAIPVNTPTTSKVVAPVSDGVTTIIKPDNVVPGSVVISEEPLDDSELLTQTVTPIPQPPVREYNYDADSELGQALDASADLTGRISAFRSLSAAWDVDLPKQLIQPVCDVLLESGVKCLSVTSWAQLQRFNRPIIMVLDQNQSLHRVILFKLEQDTAQLIVGESVLTVSIDELRSRWANNGVTLWRPTSAGSTFYRSGDASFQIPEVRKLLNDVLTELDMPEIDDLGSTNFDSQLSQALLALQSRFSILVDGELGNETYLLFNEVLSPNETPVLIQRVP